MRNVGTSSSLLRDGDIRAALQDFLVSEHRELGDTTILHEMKVYRPTARVDLAVVNGELSAFEIKSDVDSLARLADQIPAYGTVFDRVSLVTTSRHLRSARQKIPSWWGIAVSDGKSVTVRRTAKRNSGRRVESLLYSLNRSELIKILRTNEVEKGLLSGTASAMIKGIVERIKPLDIDRSCRQVLKIRRGFYISSSSSSSSVEMEANWSRE